MSTKINVGIVDDQLMFRQGMISVLKDYDELNISLEASDGKELLTMLENGNVPDVLLLDLEMPLMNGIETLQIIREKKIDVKVLIITMHDEEEMVVHLIEKGANGFLAKNEAIENVVEAITAVKQNNYFFNDKFSKAILHNLMSTEKIEPKFASTKLNERELQIVQHICDELTNKEIAARLNLSNRTVDGYRERILRKIRAKNTAGIVMYAIKFKLIKA
ncbi:MAG: response regulator transcription factor [Bacteroidota bacterium]|nr:response regulator transcription factor [Bacteroidota bacterium]